MGLPPPLPLLSVRVASEIRSTTTKNEMIKKMKAEMIKKTLEMIKKNNDFLFLIISEFLKILARAGYKNQHKMYDLFLNRPTDFLF